MPDVHVWHDPELAQDDVFGGHDTETFLDFLKKSVAQHMDCRDDYGEMMKHDPQTQIEILTFQPYGASSTKKLTIHVVAYDWPDRMRTINNRMAAIGAGISGLLGLPEGTLSLSYIPMPRGNTPAEGCWAKV